MRAYGLQRGVPALVTAAALMLAPDTAWSQSQAGEVLLRVDSEGSVPAWRHVGKADFDLDAVVSHSGKRAARITITPAEEPQYQQWQYDIAGVCAGDAFSASVWVRTSTLVGGTGAYFVLEYLDAGGTRCGINHSRIILRNHGSEWQKLTASGAATTAARTLRVGLVLNAHGTAWFDDLEVTRTERLVPWPDLGTSERVVTIHSDQIVQPHFGGVGYHVFHHVHPVTPQLFDQVVGKRWREVDPSFVRMNHSWDWGPAQIETAARHMAFFKSTGTEIYLTTWNPKQVKTVSELAAYAHLIVDQLEFFKRHKGLENLKYYCMTNEEAVGCVLDRRGSQCRRGWQLRGSWQAISP